MLGSLGLVMIIGIFASLFFEFAGIGCIDAGQGCLSSVISSARLFEIFPLFSIVLLLLRNFMEL